MEALPWCWLGQRAVSVVPTHRRRQPIGERGSALGGHFPARCQVQPGVYGGHMDEIKR